MSYAVEQNLISGEKLIYQTGLHWSVMFWSFVFALIIAAGGVVCLLQKDTNYLYAGVFLLVVAGTIIVFATVKRNAVEMAVTNRRVIIKTGLLGRRSLEIMLAKVEVACRSRLSTGFWPAAGIWNAHHSWNGRDAGAVPPNRASV